MITLPAISLIGYIVGAFLMGIGTGAILHRLGIIAP